LSSFLKILRPITYSLSVRKGRWKDLIQRTTSHLSSTGPRSSCSACESRLSYTTFAALPLGRGIPRSGGMHRPNKNRSSPPPWYSSHTLLTCILSCCPARQISRWSRGQAVTYWQDAVEGLVAQDVGQIVLGNALPSAGFLCDPGFEKIDVLFCSVPGRSRL